MSLLMLLSISLALSTATCGILAAPLRALLTQACGDSAGVRFWVRFNVLTLYLCPLVVALLFGLPAQNPASAANATMLDALPRMLSAATFGVAIALAAVGIRLSSLRPAAPPTGPSAARSDWRHQ